MDLTSDLLLLGYPSVLVFVLHVSFLNRSITSYPVSFWYFLLRASINQTARLYYRTTPPVYDSGLTGATPPVHGSGLTGATPPVHGSGLTGATPPVHGSGLDSVV